MDNIESENAIQNLDSLWFFSNILLSKNPRNSSSFLQKPITNKQNNSNNTILNLKIPSSNSPNTSSSIRKIIPNKADNGDIHDTDNHRSLRAKEEGREVERLSKMKRRVKKYLLQTQSITCNVEGINDGDVLKKHLRTWAVAVAYSALHNTNSSIMVACS